MRFGSASLLEAKRPLRTGPMLNLPTSKPKMVAPSFNPKPGMKQSKPGMGLGTARKIAKY